jgi:phage shock protein PspC (stress-responsive transcriptional regulator)
MTETVSEPEAPPHRLRRSTSDRMVAGVCGGLADFTGLDPVIFRVTFAVATVFGGAGLAAYVLAWLIIPDGNRDDSHATTLLRGRGVGRTVLLVLGGIAVLAILGPISGSGHGHWGGGGLGLIVLLVVGVWLWNRSNPPGDTPTAATAGVPIRPRRDTPIVAAAPAGGPRPPRRRSKLFALTMSAVLVLAGVLAAIDASGAGDVTARVALALVLLVVGAGLLIGSVVGSARALIPIGLLLVVATAVTTVADIPGGGTGERRWRPTSVAELRGSYRLSAGDAELDLRALELGGRTRRVRLRVGIGQLTVLLPDGVPVTIDAHTGAGALHVPGRNEDGWNLTRSTSVVGDGGAGRLVLDLSMGFGELTVQRPVRLLEVPR